jgi:addiction module RelE/StbE family toxin
MNIIWTKPAKKDLKKIFNYFKQKVSLNIALNIINSILSKTSILETHSIGVKEELLAHLNQEHRSIIDGNYKIIYFIHYKTVYITHVFDTRQNPVKLK